MNILMLNPPRRDKMIMGKEGRCMQRRAAFGYVMPPYSMVIMATWLREHGHRVRVIDAVVQHNDFKVLSKVIAADTPHIVFINTSTPTIDDDIFAADQLKKMLGPEVKTVLFGIHPSVCYADILSTNRSVDYCIIGEPELTALELCTALTAHTPTAAVPGIAYVDSQGTLLKTPDREFIKDLDVLPLPDWSLADLTNYRLPFSNAPFVLVNPIRGCPYRCTFCNAAVLYGRTPRHHSAPRVVEEIKNDIRSFGITDFLFWTEEFILDKEFVTELCRLIIAEDLHIRWTCNSRVDAIDDDIVKTIRAAGCWNMALGIESGNAEVLRSIKKDITLDQTIKAVASAKKAGLQVTGHVILGFPEDTKETMAQTVRFIKDLDLDFVQYYCAMPYPGSALYDEARTHRWINTTDWSRYDHICSILDYPHLKSKEVVALRRKLILQHYLTPRTLWHILRNHIKKPRDVLTLAKNIFTFRQWLY